MKILLFIVTLLFIWLISCSQIEDQDFWYGYSKDSNWIYYYEEKIDWFDLRSFGIITQNTWRANDTSSIYLKDKNWIYIMSHWLTHEESNIIPLTWVDSKSFELIDNSFAKDKNYLYFDAIRYETVFTWIEYIDIESLIALWNNYYQDKNNIYTANVSWSSIPRTNTIQWSGSLEILEWVDYDTFKIIDDQWAEDKYWKYSYWVKQDIK